MSFKPFDRIVVKYDTQTRRYGTFMYWIELDELASVQYDGGMKVIVRADALERA